MSAQPAEDLELIHSISARAATVSPELTAPNIRRLRRTRTDYRVANERAIAALEKMKGDGIINIPLVIGLLKGH